MRTAAIHALLVDDDEEDYMLLRDVLDGITGTRVEVDWVNCYEDAVEELKKARHDVYLFDYRLGERNGLELLKEAADIGCTAPIILLTGYGDKEVDIKAMKEGAADYLVKGKITSDLLERSIRYAIHHAEKQENIRSLFDSVFEGIIVHDLNETILEANESAGKIFGYDNEDMVGEKLENVCGGECLTEYRKVIHDASAFEKESVGQKRDGSKIFIEVVGKPYVFNRTNARILAIRDVTSKREMESQILMQERLASVGLLASGLAHEIGTPLGVIRGRAELVTLNAPEGSPEKRNGEIITEQIDRVSHLIRSLLNLARGDSTQKAHSVDVLCVVRDVSNLLGYEFRKHKIQFKCEISHDVKVAVEANSEPLQQVLLNLIVNAIHAIESAQKSGEEKQHHIRIWADESKGFWNIFVEDTGCGISEENKKHLFTPFFTTKETGVGTGLGLVNCFRIVSSWGGSIGLESQLGEGTTFRITLPKA